MECPRCKGLKIIHVRAVPGVHQQYDVECPVCGGTGELPNSAELPKHCPACGEPIHAGETWCDRHKPAEQLEQALNSDKCQERKIIFFRN